MVERGELSEGHARAVLAVPDQEGPRRLAREIVKTGHVGARGRAAGALGRGQAEAADQGRAGRSGAGRPRPRCGGAPDRAAGAADARPRSRSSSPTSTSSRSWPRRSTATPRRRPDLVRGFPEHRRVARSPVRVEREVRDHADLRSSPCVRRVVRPGSPVTVSSDEQCPALAPGPRPRARAISRSPDAPISLAERRTSSLVDVRTVRLVRWPAPRRPGRCRRARLSRNAASRTRDAGRRRSGLDRARSSARAFVDARTAP